MDIQSLLSPAASHFDVASSTRYLPALQTLLAQAVPVTAQPLPPPNQSSVNCIRFEIGQRAQGFTLALQIGGGTSGIEPKKQSKQGTHWREKVEHGQGPKPFLMTTEWAKIRKDKERELEGNLAGKGQEIELPWAGKTETWTGNKIKTLFLELCLFESKGVVELERDHRAESFFGITKIIVPQSKRAEFDTGLFPSLNSTGIFQTPKGRDPKYKEISMLWKTAGFTETLNKENGQLTFSYNDKLQKKVRESFSKSRKRREARAQREKAGV